MTLLWNMTLGGMRGTFKSWYPQVVQFTVSANRNMAPPDLHGCRAKIPSVFVLERWRPLQIIQLFITVCVWVCCWVSEKSWTSSGEESNTKLFTSGMPHAVVWSGRCKTNLMWRISRCIRRKKTFPELNWVFLMSCWRFLKWMLNVFFFCPKAFVSTAVESQLFSSFVISKCFSLS